MKILKFLTSKAGKMAFSPLQAVGLSAAVGIAGIAAWQMMSSPSEVNPDTVFSSADNDVVFVAGTPGATGGYGANYGMGGAYEEGGAVRSGIHTRMSADMRLMQQDQMKANLPAETPEVIQKEESVRRYNMTGASEGLGLGQNEATRRGGAGQGDLSSIQAQIAALQAGVEQKQAEAAAAAAAQGGGDVAAAAAAALGKGGASGGKWGMSSGMARASGNNLNSTPLQAGRGAGGADGRARSSGTLGGAERGPARLGTGRTPMFDGGKDAIIAAGRGFGMNADTLAGLSKQSKEVAGNRARSVNEGARIFMGGEQLSGGISLNGDTVTIGASSSSDFNDDVSLGNLGGAISGIQEEVTSYSEDMKQLQSDLKSFAKKASWCSAIPVLSIIVGYGACVPAREKIKKKVNEFESKWGETNYEKESTHGPFTTVARDSYRKIYNAIAVTGAPWVEYKRAANKFWNADEESGENSSTGVYSSSQQDWSVPSDGLSLGSK